MINLHSSLLPRWRGAAPIIYSLMAGDQVTGVTVMKVEPRHYDVGNIILQTEVEVPPTMLLPELHQRLSREGASLMLRSLANIEEFLEKSIPQPKEGVTYAPKVEGHALSYLDWEKQTSQEAFDLYRALYGFRPVLTEFNGSVVKILDMKVLADHHFQAHHPKGLFLFDRDQSRLVVNCRENSSVAIERVQVIGKKPMSAIQFINGFVKKRPESEWVFNAVAENNKT